MGVVLNHYVVFKLIMYLLHDNRKVIRSGFSIQRRKRERDDVRVLRDFREELISVKLGVHECEGVAWKIYKAEFEADWESH